LYKLTSDGGRGKPLFKTDYSNASRTQLLDLDKLNWSQNLAKEFGISAECLAEICPSDSLFGETTMEGLFPEPVPIHAMLGDSHAALFAEGCHEPFTAKATYGTGSSVMLNAGGKRPKAGDGIVTSLAWYMEGKVQYALEGNINYTGAVTKWLVNDIELLKSSKEAGIIAESVADTGGVYLVPAFTGLGAPYFDDNARAAIVGMREGTKKAHIVRASEECIAWQIKDVVEAMNAATGKPLTVLRADGGPTRDKFLMRFQADILGIPVAPSSVEELSGAGAAWCAAISAGLSKKDDIFRLKEGQNSVKPNMDIKQREKLYAGWKQAVNMVRSKV
jgi:glycerol kinase